jgi:hypothetical protein
MRTGRRIRGVAVATVAASAMALPAVAGANTYCVHNIWSCLPGEIDKGSNLQGALDDASANPPRDRVRIAGGTYARAGGFSYVDPADPVDIVGAGPDPVGGTALFNSEANPSAQDTLTVSAAGSTVSHLSVAVPRGTGSTNTGIRSQGTLDDVLVFSGSPPSAFATGIFLDAGGRLVNSVVSIRENGLDSIGVEFGPDDVRVRNSVIDASEGLFFHNPGGTARISRASVLTGQVGVVNIGGTVTIEDSLVLVRPEGQLLRDGLLADTTAGDSRIDANHVTLVGPGGDNHAFAVRASATRTAQGRLRNSVISGFDTALARTADPGGTSNLSADYSAYPAHTQSSGAGTLTQLHHSTAAPGFLGPHNFNLAPGSALIDAGDPAGLSAGESPLDLAGRPRITDGDGNCVRRRDIGALEFQAGPRAPRAAAAATPRSARVRRRVTFDARASCDPDGGALAFLWRFDDGRTAAGPLVGHAFARAGRHTAVVTVGDATGRSAKATVEVRVRPFAGVGIPTQTVTASKKGRAPVSVNCPRSASGSCRGRLTLRAKRLGRVGRRGFSIPAGKRRRVRVKLSRRARRALGRGRTIKATASAAARDGAGQRRTTKGKVTIKPA